MYLYNYHDNYFSTQAANIALIIVLNIAHPYCMLSNSHYE